MKDNKPKGLARDAGRNCSLQWNSIKGAGASLNDKFGTVLLKSGFSLELLQQFTLSSTAVLFTLEILMAWGEEGGAWWNGERVFIS